MRNPTGKMPNNKKTWDGGQTPGGKRPPADMKVLGRALKLLFASYPKLMVLVICCIIFSSIRATPPAIFQQ